MRKNKNMPQGIKGFQNIESVRHQIQECEGKHSQQVAYSSFHDALTQVCFGCRKVRSNKRI